MNLSNFISGDFLKYAVITLEAYSSSETAQSITGSPAPIGDDYIILSINPDYAELFAKEAESLGFDFEFEFIEGSGKVSLLTHDQAVELTRRYSKNTEEII